MPHSWVFNYLQKDTSMGSELKQENMKKVFIAKIFILNVFYMKKQKKQQQRVNSTIKN